jgi:hypothetical protein
MDITFLNNTCLGHQMFVELKLNKKYNNPFIGSLFVNDYDFIKYCNNLNYYINVIPKFDKGNQNNLWMKSKIAKKGGYPIMYLDEIEIHWIHEKSGEKDKLLEKYNRRNERFKKFINKKNSKIIIIFSFNQLMNQLSDIPKFINDYYNISTKNTELVFIGPSKFNNIQLKNNCFYQSVKKWDNFNGKRTENCLYTINSHKIIHEEIKKYLKNRPFFNSIY